MEIPWPDARCVLCLSSERPLTKAHLIPEGIGGKLFSPCLCGSCNSDLGSRVESNLKRDPQIRLAIDALENESIQIAAMAERQSYLAEVDGLQVRARRESGRRRVRDSVQADGSLVKSDAAAIADLRTSMRRAGAAEAEIAAALERVEAAPRGEMVEVGARLAVRKGSTGAFAPDLRGELTPDTCFLSIAYLFVATLQGERVYGEHMQPVRDALREGHGPHQWSVEPLGLRPPYQPWHGLRFDTSHLHLAVEIRLFGILSWIVHFRGIDDPRAAEVGRYQLRLPDGEEIWLPD